MKSFKLILLGAALSTLSIALPVNMPKTVQAQGNTPKEPLPVAVFQAAGPIAARWKWTRQKTRQPWLEHVD